ncbi:toprim domain-containing protein [Atopomonas sediminilitoris]|uniref:toprim domain-containing protein n=1 Tax=Atopomonas sediminilitoris TaxID=2919919 RepID=UPI001F4E6141|nr:toprim domain-containing protein [Atopomonas sediminilitoris]MCJ8168370.1 toprim domain-containing protein [Atopomonas sediminilitoris]
MMTHYTTNEVQSAFWHALQAVHGQRAPYPVPDGQIRRFRGEGDKAGARNCWYVLHMDGRPRGCFGSWKTGDTVTWCLNKDASPIDRQQLARQVAEAKRKREEETKQRHHAAAIRAAELWQSAKPASASHPYLAAKGCQPHHLRQRGDLLLVPLLVKGCLVNLQTINRQGFKLFNTGGRVKGAGAYFGTIEAGQTVYVCEGWATGATLYESTGCAVVAAMNAGNLLAVGQEVQRRHPAAVLVIACDDDRKTTGNPGITAGNQAARALGVGAIKPDWPQGAPDHLSDFNDLRQFMLEAR